MESDVWIKKIDNRIKQDKNSNYLNFPVFFEICYKNRTIVNRYRLNLYGALKISEKEVPEFYQAFQDLAYEYENEER